MNTSNDTASKFVELTKDISDYDLIRAVEDYDKDTIPENSLLRALAHKMHGKSDLGAMMMLALPLCVILAHRLKKRNYMLSETHKILKDTAEIVEQQLKSNI